MKKILSVILTAFLLLSMLSFTALASENDLFDVVFEAGTRTFAVSASNGLTGTNRVLLVVKNGEDEVVYMNTTSNGAFPGGDAFMVYPLDVDGEVVCSHRLYVFNEGFQDLRALEMLEGLTDRETVLSLLEEIEGFRVYPRNNDYIIKLREKINQMIKAYLK